MEPGHAKPHLGPVPRALERPAEERSAFLKEACDGDAALRRRSRVAARLRVRLGAIPRNTGGGCRRQHR